MTSDATAGGIALALIGVIVKIWVDSSSNTRKIIDVVEKNASAMSELKSTIAASIQVQKDSAEASRNLSERIKNVIRPSNKNN